MKLDFLRRNIGYKLFALVLSVMLHIIATAQQNPSGVRDQYVQPEIVKLPDTLLVGEPPPTSADQGIRQGNGVGAVR